MRTGLSTCLLTAICLSALGTIGCMTPTQNFDSHGVVFYCDGAGGGGIMNWGPGVKKGLKDAGFDGTFDEFSWETGLGVVADQTESVKDKRAQAAKLAGQIVAYKSKFPGSPVHIMGLSAGTAVVAFTLEKLPESASVDTAVMLSGSLSSSYDMTRALSRVKGNMYVTTSENDAILHDAVPMLGSADRQDVGDRVCGIDGFRPPMGCSAMARRLYSKVVIIAWNSSFEKYGDFGGHTDSTDSGFIQHVIAPLIMREGPQYMHVHPQGSAGSRSS